MPEAERILRLIEDGDFVLERLEAWCCWPHAIRVRYEDLKRNTSAVLEDLLYRCDLLAKPGAVARAVRANSFAARARRNTGIEETGAFLREGIVGD